jgi:large subunit ribosomal protein L21
MATETKTPAAAKAKADKKTKRTTPKKVVKKVAPKTSTEKTNVFAVIKTGGKQYLVKPGDVLKIEKLAKPSKGDKINFDKVLLLDDGKDIKIGAPFIKGAKVEAKYEEEGKAKKVTVLRYKSKTRQHTKKGHRQPYTKVSITSIR